jgi:two-component system OmpR family response regulator/two-component system response regulator QseB
VRDGEAAEREQRAESYAAAVLDLGLPLKDGMQVPAAVRQAGITLPVLVLTARNALPDRICGLDVGADASRSRFVAQEGLSPSLAHHAGNPAFASR